VIIVVPVAKVVIDVVGLDFGRDLVVAVAAVAVAAVAVVVVAAAAAADG
jgi:hypothetical protein